MKSLVKPNAMNCRRLILSEADHSRLVSALKSDLAIAILTEQELKWWSTRLREARIMNADLAERVVAMNSIVQLLDVDTGTSETFQLVFPEDANISEGKLSVLASKGQSLLGGHLGEALVWSGAHGDRRLCIEAIRGPNGSTISAGLSTSVINIP